jgi:hypothetical protein
MFDRDYKYFECNYDGEKYFLYKPILNDKKNGFMSLILGKFIEPSGYLYIEEGDILVSIVKIDGKIQKFAHELYNFRQLSKHFKSLGYVCSLKYKPNFFTGC